MTRRVLPMALAFAGWAGAVGLALWAQSALGRGEFLRAGSMYGLAILLATVAIAVIERGAPPEKRELGPDLAQGTGTVRRRPAAVVLLLAGLAATASSVGVLARSDHHGIAVALWCAGLVLTGAALATGARGAWRFEAPTLDRARVAEIAVVAAILFVALSLRLPDLTNIPPEVHGDEAACGLEARKILHGEMPAWFGFGWYDVPNPSFAISAASMAVFGDDLFGFRMASVLQGLASIFLLYLVARRLFGARVAALAAFFLAISHWHIHFSRSGIHYIQATFATVLLVHCLVIALEKRRAVYFLLTGFAAGFCEVVYYAARLAPMLALWIIACEALRAPANRRRYAVGALAFALGLLLFVAPFAVPAAVNPKAVFSRGEGVFVLTEENLRHSRDFYRVDSTLGVLGMQAVNTLTAFNARGDRSGQHGHPAPLIDFYTSALFALGVAVALWRVRRGPYFLLDSWLWATLVTGAILTLDPVFSPRLVGVLPALFIFPALVVDAGWRGAEWLFGRVGRALFALPVLLFLALATRANYQDYFELHIKRLQTANFYTVLARYIERVNDRYRIYLIGNEASSVRQYTVQFLVPETDGVDIPPGALQLPLRRIPADKGASFVVDANVPGAKDRLAALGKAYPAGATEEHKDGKGFLLFYTHTLDHAGLLAAYPDATADVAVAKAAPAPEPQAPAAPAPAPAEQDRGKQAWSSLPDMAELRAVAIAQSGEVYALDRASGSVLMLEANGRIVRSTSLRDAAADSNAVDLRALAVGPSGHLFVLDASRNTVHELGADGSRVRTIALPGGYFPSGLTTDERGKLFIADTGSSRVLRADPDGATFAEFGRGAAGDARLDQPTGVAVGPDGEIFAADVGHQRIAVFGPDLELRRQWSAPRSGTLHGMQLAVGAGHVFASDPDGGRVVEYDAEGRVLGERGAGELVRPVGVALDGKGNLYVADVGARAIFRYAVSPPGTAPTASR